MSSDRLLHSGKQNFKKKLKFHQIPQAKEMYREQQIPYWVPYLLNCFFCDAYPSFATTVSKLKICDFSWETFKYFEVF